MAVAAKGSRRLLQTLVVLVALACVVALLVVLWRWLAHTYEEAMLVPRPEDDAFAAELVRPIVGIGLRAVTVVRVNRDDGGWFFIADCDPLLIPRGETTTEIVVSKLGTHTSSSTSAVSSSGRRFIEFKWTKGAEQRVLLLEAIGETRAYGGVSYEDSPGFRRRFKENRKYILSSE